MKENLLILGAGGHGRVVKETADAMDCFARIDFLDDNSEIAIGKCINYRMFVNKYTYAFIALGNNELRMKWYKELTKVGFQIPFLVDPTAYISPSANIAAGSIVCAKAVVNTNVRIEKGCIISIGALIDHDCIIGEYSHINTGAIIKANSKLERLQMLDSGRVYANKMQ
ncbi:hypothetical protein [Bacillus sp. AFS077874]|uniref:PglD-related sugar-binding protein n=1 Tax=Bacillus sp. AFS077874 TaxID=2033513 RepID=UPI00159660FB|nr:hypothetical protein [Bacillus sp. AFS077874]